MLVRIDPSGNVLFGSDNATASAKNMVLYLIAVLAKSRLGIEYDQNSSIKDIEYDDETTQIHWTENGSQQSYAFNTSSMQQMLNSAFNEAFPALTISDIDMVVRLALGISDDENAVDVISAQHESQTGVITDAITNAQGTINTATVDTVAAAKSDLVTEIRSTRDATIEAVTTNENHLTDLVNVAAQETQSDVADVLEAVGNIKIQTDTNRDEPTLALTSHACSIVNTVLNLAEGK